MLNPGNVLVNLMVMPLVLPLNMLPYLEMFYTQPIGGWSLAYTLIWIAWMNAAVGLTNALPIIPFDGGNSLKAMLDSLLGKLPVDKRDKIINAVLAVISIFSIALILAPIVVPRLR